MYSQCQFVGERPMKIKDENGDLVEIEPDSILAVVKNATKYSPLKSMILFMDDSFSYMFSVEEKETILERIKGENKK